MIYVHFSDLDEFLIELEREWETHPENRPHPWKHGTIERGIVRFTSRLHDTGIPGLMVQRISFIAGFIVREFEVERLVQIDAPCGGYPLNGPGFEEKHAEVIDRAKALEASLLATLERLGLEGRNGAFRISE